MSTPPRFHQSYAKTLLNDCPALLRIQLAKGRTPSRAMAAGSLLDYLVFGQDDRFEVVDARYKSGPREGEECTDWTSKDARAARDEAQARGLLPVLGCELDALEGTAVAIRARIIGLARDMAGPYEHSIHYQPVMQWTSDLGVLCEGTPDVVVQVHMRDLTKVCTIDVKHTAFLPMKRFCGQVFAMGWDIQGAAYREGSTKWSESELSRPAFHMEHVILASSSTAVGLPPCKRNLSPTYMAVGKKRWEEAQAIWQRCLDTDDWPGYPEDDAEPSHYLVRTEIEKSVDPSVFEHDEDIEP